MSCDSSSKRKNLYPFPHLDPEGNKYVTLDDTLDHHVWNGINALQYKVIFSDGANIANLVPKKEYSLVITDITHGSNIKNITYDCDPYTYQSFNKVV